MTDGIEAMKARREAARAARTPPQSRHPREQPTSEQGAETAGISASEKASEQAGAEAGESASVPARPVAGEVPRQKTSGTASSSARKGGGAARRRGRPRGPERVTLSVRILTDLDARLTAECEAAGAGPQEVVEAALSAYLARQERRRPS